MGPLTLEGLLANAILGRLLVYHHMPVRLIVLVRLSHKHIAEVGARGFPYTLYVARDPLPLNLDEFQPLFMARQFLEVDALSARFDARGCSRFETLSRLDGQGPEPRSTSGLVFLPPSIFPQSRSPSQACRAPAALGFHFEETRTAGLRSYVSVLRLRFVQAHSPGCGAVAPHHAGLWLGSRADHNLDRLLTVAGYVPADRRRATDDGPMIQRPTE